MTEQKHSKKASSCTLSHPKNIPDMLLKRIHVLAMEIYKIETEIGKLQKECEEKTSCYLRYGAWTRDYAPGGPHNDNYEEWQIVLAEFYSEQTTHLLQKRDCLLVKKWRLTSRYLKITQDPFVPAVNIPRLRKPYFQELIE